MIAVHERATLKSEIQRIRAEGDIIILSPLFPALNSIFGRNAMTKKGYTYIRKTFTINGKRFEVSGKTLEDVIRKKIEIEQQQKEKEIKKNNVTVSEWTETALARYKPNVSDEYLYQMTMRIDKHILSYIGDKRLQDVTPLDCQTVLMHQSNASKSQLRKLSQELKFIFDTARKNKLIRDNPAEDLSIPSGTEGKRRSLTASEREHFLKVCADNPQYLLFRLMLFCGLRSSEAIRLTYEDITTIQGVQFFHIHDTKTAAGDRLVPIPTEIRADLDPEGRGVIALNAAGHPFDKSAYRRLSDHLRRDMNISMGCTVYRNQLIPPLPLADDFVPYMLRHTYCTDLKKKGVDLRLAKQLMGHADIKMTADIYDHADDESALLAAAQLGLVPT